MATRARAASTAQRRTALLPQRVVSLLICLQSRRCRPNWHSTRLLNRTHQLCSKWRNKCRQSSASCRASSRPCCPPSRTSACGRCASRVSSRWRSAATSPTRRLPASLPTRGDIIAATPAGTVDDAVYTPSTRPLTYGPRRTAYQQCLQKAQLPEQRASQVVQTELNDFQGRLQRAIATCQDDVKDGSRAASDQIFFTPSSQRLLAWHTHIYQGRCRTDGV